MLFCACRIFNVKSYNVGAQNNSEAMGYRVHFQQGLYQGKSDTEKNTTKIHFFIYSTSISTSESSDIFSTIWGIRLAAVRRKIADTNKDYLFKFIYLFIYLLTH